jgi:hypothetical protein
METVKDFPMTCALVKKLLTCNQTKANACGFIILVSKNYGQAPVVFPTCLQPDLHVEHGTHSPW